MEAVEKFEAHLIEYGFDLSLHKFEIQTFKAMEKENIINFALQCMFGRTDIGSNLKNDFIKKYNETFKSE